MDNQNLWKEDNENKDKESRGSVKIVSEESGEQIGELKFNFTTKKERE